MTLRSQNHSVTDFFIYLKLSRSSGFSLVCFSAASTVTTSAPPLHLSQWAACWATGTAPTLPPLFAFELPQFWSIKFKANVSNGETHKTFVSRVRLCVCHGPWLKAWQNNDMSNVIYPVKFERLWLGAWKLQRLFVKVNILIFPLCLSRGIFISFVVCIPWFSLRVTQLSRLFGVVSDIIWRFFIQNLFKKAAVGNERFVYWTC